MNSPRAKVRQTPPFHFTKTEGSNTHRTLLKHHKLSKVLISGISSRGRTFNSSPVTATIPSPCRACAKTYLQNVSWGLSAPYIQVKAQCSQAICTIPTSGQYSAPASHMWAISPQSKSEVIHTIGLSKPVQLLVYFLLSVEVETLLRLLYEDFSETEMSLSPEVLPLYVYKSYLIWSVLHTFWGIFQGWSFFEQQSALLSVLPQYLQVPNSVPDLVF